MESKWDFEEDLDKVFASLVDIGDTTRMIVNFYDIYNILTEKISPDFAEFIYRIFEVLLNAAKQRAIDIENDCVSMEGDIEASRNDFQDIYDLLHIYLKDLDLGKQKFSRQRVLPILKQAEKIAKNALDEM